AFAGTYYDPSAKQQLNEINVVKAATGEKVAEWKRPAYYLGALAFSQDSKTLAAAGPAVVDLLDVTSGKERAQLTGSMQVTAMAFSPDGRSVAVAGGGGANGNVAAITVWELATRSVRFSLVGHKGTVDCLAFSPDGRVLASA